MKTIRFTTSQRLKALITAFTSGLLTSGMLLPAYSQITSDGTNNTIVNQSDNNFTILNGIEKGNNLFHSFSNFSVPTGGSATFDLTHMQNITTIFSRVTGGNISHIDGLVKTLNSNNAVSLFLMNPNGIVFGKNARLDISGSLSTHNLRILDSGAISSIAVSSGQTGTIQVSAANQIEIAVYNPIAFSESSLSTFTQGCGNANSTVINTSKLVIQGGASLGSSTLATGSAGSVEVKASESIYVEGRATQGNAAKFPTVSQQTLTCPAPQS